MKFSLLAVTAVHLGTCAYASPIEAEHDAGWWDEDPVHTLKSRAFPNGQSYTLTQVQNKNYKKLSAPREIYRTFTKYHKTPPKALQEAYGGSELKAAGTQKGSATANPSQNYDTEYVVPVKLGTPAQSTYLNLDTGSADLWTFSTDTSPDAQAGHILYKPKKSTTAKLMAGQNWEISYGDGSGAYGIVYRDLVQVGATSVASQAVESAQYVSDSIQTDTFSSGIMGMAFSSLNTVYPTQQKTYFDNVASSLASPVFTANLKSQKPGTYTFGYINASEYTGTSIYYTKSTSTQFWQLNATGYQVGTNAYKTTANVPAIVDTGTTLLLLPSTIVNAYYAKVTGASYYADWAIWRFPCTATPPDLRIGVGTYRGFIPGKFMNFGPLGDGTCYGGLQSSDGLDWAILGDIFLKAQFVVFNMGNKTIGFANKPT